MGFFWCFLCTSCTKFYNHIPSFVLHSATQSTDFSKKIAFLPISLGLWQNPQASHVQLGLQTREIQSTRNACSFLLPVMGPNTEQTCLGINTYHEASGEAPKSKKIQKKHGQHVHFGVSILHFVHRKSVCRPNRPQNPAS